MKPTEEELHHDGEEVRLQSVSTESVALIPGLYCAILVVYANYAVQHESNKLEYDIQFYVCRLYGDNTF